MLIEVFYAFFAFFAVTGRLGPANQPLEPTAAQRLGWCLLLEPFYVF
jgi:hypothetical protein